MVTRARSALRPPGSWLAIAVFNLLFLSISLYLPPASAALAPSPSSSWPHGPLTTTNRWILNFSGAKIVYVGANWPGSLDTMVPEGLQYQSIEGIVGKIKSLGMNAVRLTYATQMVDEYYANGEKDVLVHDAFVNALGEEEGERVWGNVRERNPGFGEGVGRLQVYDAIAAECAKQEIYLHLDNHVSKAGWCCSPLDGNTWWNDDYFDVSNWTRGLAFMAERGKNWPSLTSLSLRNEPRIPLSNPQLLNTSYNWADWYKYMRQGADAIHSANPDVLIFLSGIDSDTDLSAVVNKDAPLTPSTAVFDRAEFNGYGDEKLVLELHVYDNILGNTGKDCDGLREGWVEKGFKTLDENDGDTARFPLVVTEFGFPQDGSGGDESAYASCALDYFAAQHAGWMIWSLGGSYYIREGMVDYDEGWGLLSHDWSSLRNPGFVNTFLVPAVKTSTAPINGTRGSGNTNTPSGGGDDDSQASSPGDGSSDDKPSSAPTLDYARVGVAVVLGVIGAVIMGFGSWR
ncbi:glycoside hydrolase superfamily [Nemania sp. FL0916]|nr:glycoside hydrolase superfamily [Nemania sp. FL0916]